MLAALGLWLASAAAFLWSADSLRYGDGAEASWCALAGGGLLLAGIGAWRGIPAWLATGLLMAGVTGLAWILRLAASDPFGVWVLYGVGLVVAAAGALVVLRRPGWAWAAGGLPAGALVVAVASLRMLLQQGPDASLNGAAVLLSLAGWALIALRRRGRPQDVPGTAGPHAQD